MVADLQTLQLLQACRRSLDDLNQCIHRRQWGQVKACSDHYLELISQLENSDQSGESMDAMVQLEIQHRKAMRLISAQMTRLKSDMEQLESGIQSARSSARIASDHIGR